MGNWKENCLKAHELSQSPHFKMYFASTNGKASSNAIFTSADQSDYNQAHTRLEECLNLLDVQGQYLIQFKESPGSNTPISQYTFVVPYGNGSMAAPQQIGSTMAPAGYITRQDLERELANQRAIFDKETKIERLKDELQELKSKKGKSKGMEMFFEKVEPYLPIIMGYLTRGQGGAQIGISGTKASNVPPQEEEEIENQDPTDIQLDYVLEYLTKLKGTEEAGIDYLYNLVLYLEKNPASVAILDGLIKNKA